MTQRLREHVLGIRPHTRNKAGVLAFDPMPLFVAVTPLLDDNIFKAIAYAVDDGHGAPEDLEPRDRRQTARLEAALIERCGDCLQVEELITVEARLGFGFFEVSLLLATTPGGCLIGYHDPEEAPGFYAAAMGPRDALLAFVAKEPETTLPMLLHDHDEVVRVVVRRRLPWTTAQAVAVVRALAGDVDDDAIMRQDLLQPA